MVWNVSFNALNRGEKRIEISGYVSARRALLLFLGGSSCGTGLRSWSSFVSPCVIFQVLGNDHVRGSETKQKKAETRLHLATGFPIGLMRKAAAKLCVTLADSSDPSWVI